MCFPLGSVEISVATGSGVLSANRWTTESASYRSYLPQCPTASFFHTRDLIIAALTAATQGFLTMAINLYRIVSAVVIGATKQYRALF
jgi:hypothetical protein